MLLDVCLAVPVDYERAENLLKQGAEPLGRIGAWGAPPHPENLYTAILCELYYREIVPEDLYKITDLFLRCGMDIAKPSVPYDGDSPNPLRVFAIPSDESGEWILRTLKLLLDHGLRAEDAYECWHEYIRDVCLICDFSKPFDLRIVYDCLRKLMLIASYPHVLNADAQLRKAIWQERNHYDLMQFRNWNAFTFEPDTPLCSRYAADVTVSIIEKSSGQKVWMLGLCPHAPVVMLDEASYQ